MKLLVIGSGGREHAQTWALRRSPLVQTIYSATRNAGIQALTAAAPIDPQQVYEVAAFAARERLDLVVIGPEQPLVDGLADALAAQGIPTFGPSSAAARLEGSKIFAKEFMTRHAIPTARYLVAESAETALAQVATFGFPVVLKADGLAAGKGVIIAEDETAARQGIQALMVKRTLGAAGERLVIEECMRGRELSYLVFADGETWRAMPVAQDHKRAFDGDQGPNTGGMGAFSTAGLLDDVLEARIVNEIVEPTLRGAAADGFPFRGVLYVGLMLTADGPKVVEYNVRMGDPETQAILRRLDTDFAAICAAVAHGELANLTLEWSADATTCIVLAAQGYPGAYAKGMRITGLEAAEQVEEVVIFHAGTQHDAAGNIVTNGGRVLGVTARAPQLAQATARAYEAIARIQCDGAFYRRDIGNRPC